jgi:hypothetical protein
MFSEIEFLDGEQATEFFEILDTAGQEEAISYLSRWDWGEENPLVTELGFGTEDTVFRVGDFIVGYNRGLNYVSSYRQMKF